MKFISKILVTSLAILVASQILNGVQIDNPITAIIVAIVLSFLNAVVKPIMIILTIPVTILTLGFFLFIINVMMVMLADHLVDGLAIDGFGWAAAFSLVLWITTMILEGLGKQPNNSNSDVD